MQTRNDGTHVILPAAAPIARRPDRAGLSVTLLRHSDGKVRHDGSRAANKQRCYPVAERGRLHGASELNARVRDRGVEHRIVYYRRLEKERRWKESLAKYDRLRRQDKRAHIVGRSVGCFFRRFRHFSHIGALYCNVRFYNKLLIWCESLQGAKRIRWLYRLRLLSFKRLHRSRLRTVRFGDGEPGKGTDASSVSRALCAKRRR